MTSPNTIRLDAIVASTTNPRKHFDKAPVQELAVSIAKHGVLQAILVRPNGSDGTYELVAGERRWRAAKIAKLERIPATVRELTDTEVLEIQVVENLQRADLHPLEEAEGYEALMKCHHADGHAYTADEIAAKVGKSKSYIYQRLKLTSLTPKAREAFYEGRLDASKALLVARVPESIQAEALERVCGGPNGDDWVPSFREAREIIRDEYMLDLRKPPFDVKAIYFAPNQTTCADDSACRTSCNGGDCTCSPRLLTPRRQLPAPVGRVRPLTLPSEGGRLLLTARGPLRLPADLPTANRKT